MLRTAEEILKESLVKIDCQNIKKNVVDRWDQFRKEESTKAIVEAINTARKESIEECAMRATAEADWHRGRFTGNAYVDERSILNLINELK